jgi:hypothetical protein
MFFKRCYHKVVTPIAIYPFTAHRLYSIKSITCKCTIRHESQEQKMKRAVFKILAAVAQEIFHFHTVCVVKKTSRTFSFAAPITLRSLCLPVSGKGGCVPSLSVLPPLSSRIFKSFPLAISVCIHNTIPKATCSWLPSFSLLFSTLGSYAPCFDG